MGEAVEELVEEARDPFGRRVALTVAVLAVALSVVKMVGDNARLDASLATTRMANKWAYYQSKSLKEHSYALEKDLLSALAPSAVDETRRQKLLEVCGKQIEKYEREKAETKVEAEALEREVDRNALLNDRCDLGGLLLEVAIVFGSIAILVRWRAFWAVAIVLGLAGAGWCATGFARATLPPAAVTPASPAAPAPR